MQTTERKADGTLRDAGTRIGPAGRVLVVEDDPDIRETLSEALGWEGYQVTAAANGREALDMLRRGPRTDVILLDLMMPVMSGWEFRRVQLDDPSLAGIPVVVASASAPGNMRPDRFLPKPFSIDDLLAVVAELVGSRRLAA